MRQLNTTLRYDDSSCPRPVRTLAPCFRRVSITSGFNLRFLTLTVFLLLISCNSPVYDGDMDLSEQQSVWQYLNVFSIYQDRLPDKCGNRTPEELFDIINDTLGKGRYTEYWLNKTIDNAATILETQNDYCAVFPITNSTVYIEIPDFFNSSYDCFQHSVSYLEGFDNIIIDLMNNGGGSVQLCDYIVSEFLPFNSGYIKFKYRIYDKKELEGRTVDWEIQRTNNRNPKLHKKNIAVLMNKKSASASEILISALKERKDRPGAILIGDTTYGKGIGQSIITNRLGRKDLSITSMQIRGLTDKTGDYHRKGIYPDVRVGNSRSHRHTIVPSTQIYPDVRVRDSRDSCIYYAIKALEPSALNNIIWEWEEQLLPKTTSIAKTAPIGAYFILEDPLKN